MWPFKDSPSKAPATPDPEMEKLDREIDDQRRERNRKAEELVDGHCLECRYFFLWGRTRWEGYCRRFPKEIPKNTHDYCGEFKVIAAGKRVVEA